MTDPGEFVRRVENLQDLYVELFSRHARIEALGPEADRAVVDALNREISEIGIRIEASMNALMPELRRWRERPEAWPAEVSEFVRRFLELAEKGLVETLGAVQRRAARTAEQRDRTREAIASLMRQRKGLAGYRPGGGGASPRAVDSEV